MALAIIVDQQNIFWLQSLGLPAKLGENLLLNLGNEVAPSWRIHGTLYNHK